MNFDQNNGLPAVRVTEITFSYPAGASEIRIVIRVIRDIRGEEQELAVGGQTISGVISTASLSEMVTLHDVRTGEPSGATLPKGAIVAAVNSLCREIIEGQG
jgi:hypothetical protein